MQTYKEEQQKQKPPQSYIKKIFFDKLIKPEIMAKHVIGKAIL